MTRPLFAKIVTVAVASVCLCAAGCPLIPATGTFDSTQLNQQWVLTIQGSGAPVEFHLGTSGNGTLQSTGQTGWRENVQGCASSPVPLQPISGNVYSTGFDFTFNVMGCGYSYQGTGSATFTDGRAPAARQATGTLRFSFALQGHCPQFCGVQTYDVVATRQ